ncbi:MAG TPA: hypothetical protein PKZ97_00055 [Azospirillaceae bacterium]|nr:hypothetical protein [Azospirillaceae bacterium]HRQ79489.1 hypothetical protein [Azospirillaceae bacterium]
MTDLQPHLTALRAAMAAFPPLESHTPNTAIELDEIYFPKQHAAALDPDRSLVVGNRGMGKSFWASALVNRDARRRIAEAWPQARLGHGAVEVEFGFAEGEGAIGVSKDELKLLTDNGTSAEHIWRAVTLPQIAELAEQKIPLSLADRAIWVATEPGKVREMMRTADARLTERKRKLLFVFDQLEQLADDLSLRSDLTQGILRLALAFKSYRGLRAKIFMRPDHFAEDRLFAFPDASKIKGEALHLDWRATDLYGLLYSRLLRAEPDAFTPLASQVGVSLAGQNKLPEDLLTNESLQHRIFDLVAGEGMGTRKRGLPYTWVITHLSDARNQVSPRTFLRALKFAAEHTPAPNDKAIDHLGIHEGVREASKNRVDDLKEDYPWVPPALDALRGLLVPCLPEEILEKWSCAHGLIAELRKVDGQKKPSWLEEGNDNEKLHKNLMTAMVDIGVFENRITTGKIDVPDIFRLPYNIKRKGGVTQQQRRKVRVRTSG